MSRITDFDEDNIVKALLEGAGLSAFVFHTHFQLEFFCDTNKKYNGKRLPHHVILTIQGDWWFGDKQEWDETVRKMTAGFTYVEPDEPVLAFKLAALRWTESSTVSSVALTPEKVVIMFHCGESITILNQDDCEGEPPWEIVESGYSSSDSPWYAGCAEGEIIYDIYE